MGTESSKERHLTDGELFTLAVPPAGEPEALPRHLSVCLACSRALSEWKIAMRDLAEQDADAISRRSEQDWEALEAKTLQAIRRARVGGRRSSWRWIATIAAALVLFALAWPLRKGLESRASVAAPAAELSAQDQDDDALLRDVARLSRGEEGGNGAWISLVPEPEASSSTDRGRS